MSGTRTWLITVGMLGVLAPTARAQVAFVPNVASFPNGAMMSATPVVSFDRRYVRLGMNPVFTGLEGFDTYSVPAAVTGGGIGAGGIGGGLAGFAGMNGPIAAPMGMGMGTGAGFAGSGVGAGLTSPHMAPSASSSDFEDQAWPQARAVRGPAASVRPKAVVKRRGRVTKPKKPARSATAPVRTPR